MKKLTKEQLRAEWLKLQVDGFDESELEARPKKRGDCMSAVHRPCPWVGCKHHLYLDVNPETGSITVNFPDLEPWEMAQTCSLDVAARENTLEEIGEVMNITRERVRQVEVRALLRKVKPAAEKAGMREIEIGVSHQSPMADVQDTEPGYYPSEVSFQTV